MESLMFNRCSIEDLERVSILAEEIWPISFAKILSPAQIEYMLEWMYSADQLKTQFLSGHLFYLAKMDDIEVGFVGLEPNHPEMDHLRIHKIYLHPKHQGKKIGKWMTEQVEVLAKNLKLKYLHLNVNRHNTAVDFYLKCGFKTIDTEDIDIGNGYFMNDFIMRKKL